MDKTKYKNMFGGGPIGVIISAVIFALAFFLQEYMKLPFMDSTISFTLGVVFLTIYIFFFFYTLISLPVMKRGTAVIRRGIYRIIRHPLYSTGVFFLYPALAFFARSWVILITTPVIFRVFSVVSRIEEVHMIRLFGDEYKKYMAEVGGFFPKLSGKK